MTDEIIIQIPLKKIIKTVGPKQVDTSGRISVGRALIGKEVVAYIVEADAHLPMENQNDRNIVQ
jgi:hypothetical protein